MASEPWCEARTWRVPRAETCLSPGELLLCLCPQTTTAPTGPRWQGHAQEPQAPTRLWDLAESRFFYTHLILCVLSSTEATCFALMVGKPKGTEVLQAVWEGEIHGHDQGQGCRRVVWNSRLQCQTGHKSRVPGNTTRHNIRSPLCLSPRSDLEGSQLKDLEGWLT